VVVGGWVCVFQAAKAGFAVGTDASKRFSNCLEWCGLFSSAPMPMKDTPLDSLVEILISKPEMFYVSGERDMVIMHHELVVRITTLSRTVMPLSSVRRRCQPFRPS
jgi:hypothetical protein